MHGRLSTPGLLLVVGLSALALAGCEPPRIKSSESIQSATLTNPPRDFTRAPLDPYSWGGISSATGGRDAKATYGAMAPGLHEGATQIYRPLTDEEVAARAKADNFRVYLVPDPRSQNMLGQYLASSYIGNEKDAVWASSAGVQPGMEQPPRAALVNVKRAPTPASATKSAH